MKKKSGLYFLRIAVTTALLVYVFHKSGLSTLQGWQGLFRTFSHANLTLIVVSLLLVPLLDFVSSVKWYFLARACNLAVGLWRLYAYYLVGRFFNLILPSSIGGDVVRIHEVGRYTGRYADSAAVVFVERFSGLAVLVFLALIAVVINLQVFNIPWLTTALTAGLIGVAFVCWIIIDDRPFNFLNHRFDGKIPLLSSFLAKLGKFRKAVLIYQDKQGALWVALGNSLLFYFLAIVNVWVAALVFDGEIHFVSMLIAVPVIMFIMNLPFSIGGIGLMEFSYTFTLHLFGISPEVALSVAVLMRFKSLAAAGIGGLVYPILGDKIDSPNQLSKSINRAQKEDLNV